MLNVSFSPISIRAPGDWSMRNLSTGSNVYLRPSHNPSVDASVRAIYEHIHECRHELSLFKHSVWPKVCFHILQLSGQAPVLFPLSWFPKRQEHLWHVRFMRRWVLRPVADACLQSCKSSLSSATGFRSPCAAVTGILTKYAYPPTYTLRALPKLTRP